MRTIVACVVILLLAGSCAKPYYMTREGKKKTKYYNDVFYGRQKQGINNR